MNKEEIIETLKSQYSRDLRKQLVKSLLEAEKEEETLKQYTLMNQIFSYVLAQLGWNMPSGTENWDPTPLEVIHEVFPKIMASKWYQEQQLMAKQHIDVLIKKRE
jgi:hypothetical protein